MKLNMAIINSMDNFLFVFLLSTCASGCSNSVMSKNNLKLNTVKMDGVINILGDWTFDARNDQNMTLSLVENDNELYGRVCCVSDFGNKIDCALENNLVSFQEVDNHIVKITYTSQYSGKAEEATLTILDNKKILWDMKDNNLNICPSHASLTPK